MIHSHTFEFPIGLCRYITTLQDRPIESVDYSEEKSRPWRNVKNYYFLSIYSFFAFGETYGVETAGNRS